MKVVSTSGQLIEVTTPIRHWWAGLLPEPQLPISSDSMLSQEILDLQALGRPKRDQGRPIAHPPLGIPTRVLFYRIGRSMARVTEKTPRDLIPLSKWQRIAKKQARGA
jgi:hypothetical protein